MKYPTCDGVIQVVGGPSSPFACSGTWVFSDVPAVIPASVNSGTYLVCSGVIDSSTLTCSSGWVTQKYAPPFDPAQIDPVLLSALFGAGFLLYLTPWAAAWGASQLLKLLR